MPKPKFKKIILKLSGETMMPPKSKAGISFTEAAGVAKEIKDLTSLGVGVGIVVGGGNIIRGHTVSAKGTMRSRADMMGMLATVINSMVLQQELEKIKIESLLFSSLPMLNIVPPLNRELAYSKIDAGSVVIFAGGTGNPFFSTDTAAVLRALEVDAHAIFKGTKVDGVYDSDPMKNKNAKKFDKLSYLDVLKRELKVMDLTAVSMCMDNNLPIVVFDMFKAGNLRKIVLGEPIGTIVA
ncbi:MAG: UMP kinase [Pseudomonadota bacterium]